MSPKPKVFELDVRVWFENDRYSALCPRWSWLKVSASTPAEADAAMRRQLEELHLAVR